MISEISFNPGELILLEGWSLAWKTLVKNNIIEHTAKEKTTWTINYFEDSIKKRIFAQKLNLPYNKIKDKSIKELKEKTFVQHWEEKEFKKVMSPYDLNTFLMQENVVKFIKEKLESTNKPDVIIIDDLHLFKSSFSRKQKIKKLKKIAKEYDINILWVFNNKKIRDFFELSSKRIWTESLLLRIWEVEKYLNNEGYAEVDKYVLVYRDNYNDFEINIDTTSIIVSGKNQHSNKYSRYLFKGNDYLKLEPISQDEYKELKDKDNKDNNAKEKERIKEREKGFNKVENINIKIYKK